jgi:hypothetical protein
MTISARGILLELEMLLSASLGLIAVRYVFGRWPFNPMEVPSHTDPEMLQLAAWSDELHSPERVAKRSCKP